MKIQIEISDNKEIFFLEVLKNFTFVKNVKQISNDEKGVILEIQEAIEELNKVKRGELIARNAEDLINEL